MSIQQFDYCFLVTHTGAPCKAKVHAVLYFLHIPYVYIYIIHTMHMFWVPCMGHFSVVGLGFYVRGRQSLEASYHYDYGLLSMLVVVIVSMFVCFFNR